MSERPKPLSSNSHANTHETEEDGWVEWVKIFGVSIVLAIGIRHFIAEARFIPTESMLPTLQVDDRLIIEKVSYYFRLPTRGEIIVFDPPEGLRRQQPEFRDALIKRVVGLPGDTVRIAGGQVYVNNQPIIEPYIAEAPNYEWGPTTIPEQSYFVLGDNRNRSNDSHFWGYVHEDDIIGRAVVRFWPLNRIGGIDPLPIYPDQSYGGDRPWVAALPLGQGFRLSL
ncbi:MAG: signal peptidase I [Leptolyngbya sp. DLM2.Bin15]|nr:MAG: signal peptidase I [Leptolyngbya sp. DLM2.Bin15]